MVSKQTGQEGSREVGGGGEEGPGASAAELPSLFSSSWCSAFLVFSFSLQNFLRATSCFSRVSFRFLLYSVSSFSSSFLWSSFIFAFSKDSLAFLSSILFATSVNVKFSSSVLAAVSSLFSRYSLTSLAHSWLPLLVAIVSAVS